MTKASPMAKSEMVYRELRARIVSGSYGAGHRLVLGQIADEVGVSAVPVREAIRRLEAEKLVNFTPNVGAEVAGFDVQEYMQVFETLAYLEGVATALAAPHLSHSQLDEAEAINDEMRQLAEGQLDGAQFSDLNERFHAALWSSCPNKYLVAMVEHERERVHLIRRDDFAFAAGNAAVSILEHGQLVEMIRDRAPAVELEQAVRAHKLRNSRVFVDTREP